MLNILSKEDLKKYRKDLNFLSPIIHSILQKENIFSYTVKLFENGVSIVIDISNNQILKIFPLLFKENFEAELNGLEILNQHKIKMVPNLYFFGEIENYYYIIVSKMTGITLQSVWNKIDLGNKISLINSIGEFIKSIHSIPLNNVLSAKKNWDIFLEKQIKGCSNYHAQQGVPDFFLTQIDEFISHNLPICSEKYCFISGDIHYWNVLVEEYNGQFKISGFIDYGDSFYGEPEYDFLAPAYFMARGKDAFLLKNLFLSYGYQEKELNKELSHRMLAFQLIHRFSKLDYKIKCGNLYDLSEKIWKFN